MPAADFNKRQLTRTHYYTKEEICDMAEREDILRDVAIQYLTLFCQHRTKFTSGMLYQIELYATRVASHYRLPYSGRYSN